MVVSRPVSSVSSRRAASMGVSPPSMPPPGGSQIRAPLSGSSQCSSSTRPAESRHTIRTACRSLTQHQTSAGGGEEEGGGGDVGGVVGLYAAGKGIDHCIDCGSLGRGGEGEEGVGPRECSKVVDDVLPQRRELDHKLQGLDVGIGQARVGCPAEPTTLDAARVANPVPHATSNTRCPGRTTAATSAAMNGFIRGAT